MQPERLPTRVNNACERCRRQKQRCDNFRPCTNCINTRRECVSVSTNAEPNSSHRERQTKRARTSHPSPQHASNWRDIGTPPRQSKSPTPRSQSQPSPWTNDQSIVSDFAHSESAMDMTRRVLRTQQSQQSPELRATFAIPGGDFNERRNSFEQYHTVVDLIDTELPPRSVSDKLIDIYFFTVHWFSLVVSEPLFRQRYNGIISTGLARSTDRPFLLLLLMMLVMSCHYGQSIADQEMQQIGLEGLRARYLKIVRQNYMDLIDDETLEFVQITTLLGSYWLYWGKPRSSFTILGAAIKAAQAISLHRQSTWRTLQASRQKIEEQKRVWWTIYTWDRFATVVYGRPLCISDRDCDVSMPACFTEHLLDIQTNEAADIELSLYQTNLNTIYQIASPLLENIYAIRNSIDIPLTEMFVRVRSVYEAMYRWRAQLPIALDLDEHSDLPPTASLRDKMHQLQALSLRLTYLNLMIIIHRPLLADKRHRQEETARATAEDNSVHNSSSSTTKQVYDTSFEQCLQAALSISRLAQLKPNLVQLAAKTHLLSFLAMNTFTSSVVLFICALSDVLSNSAQEAKRGLSRNLKFLRSLPHSGSLSSQCGMIVGDLINIILQKEKDEMLHEPLNSGEEVTVNKNNNNTRPRHDDHQIAMPGQSTHINISQFSQQTSHNTTARDSFNEQPINVGFEATMHQLHRVLKDASHTHLNHPSEVATQSNTLDDDSAMPHTDPDWSNGMPWTAGQFIGSDSYALDMSQFWLWDLDPSLNM